MKSRDVIQPDREMTTKKPTVLATRGSAGRASSKPRATTQMFEEAALCTSEERFQWLSETVQDGIILLDARTGKITDANPFGKKLWEIRPFRDAFSSRDAFRELQRKGTIRHKDLPLETKEGHCRDVEFVSNVYQVGDQKVVQCNVRDITESKRMGCVFKASEDRLRRVFDEGLIRTARVKKQYPFIQAKPSFCQHVGYSEQEIKKLRFKDNTPSDDLESSIKNVRDFEKGSLFTVRLPSYSSPNKREIS